MPSKLCVFSLMLLNLESNRCIRQAENLYAKLSIKRQFYQLGTLVLPLKFLFNILIRIKLTMVLVYPAKLWWWCSKETKNTIYYICYPRDWAICVNCWTERRNLENSITKRIPPIHRPWKLRNEILLYIVYSVSVSNDDPNIY